MMFDLSHDPVFPALATLTSEDLRRITGASHVTVLRVRHQPGTRAVLHVALGTEAQRREGVIWFLWPEKITRLARSHPSLQVDAATGAAFEAFPNDHRMPELARFLADRAAVAPQLFGHSAGGDPVLLRYRPGLSATFRWMADTGVPHFVKVARKARVQEQAEVVDALTSQLEGSPLMVAGVAGYAPDHSAIAYRSALGIPFDQSVHDQDPTEVTRQTQKLVAALGELWMCRMPMLPILDTEGYLHRAMRCVEIISTADLEAGNMARSRLREAAKAMPRLRHCPIHADMKPDHAFMSENLVTLIDTESLQLGDPDYDLALLDARLDVAVAEGRLDQDRSGLIRAGIRQASGPDYGWFLGLCTLHAAKYFAQRSSPDRRERLHRLLAH